jgi:hypothetical protein
LAEYLVRDGLHFIADYGQSKHWLGSGAAAEVIALRERRNLLIAVWLPDNASVID